MAGPVITFLAQMAVALLINVAAVLISKPKGPKPDAVSDLEAPTAEAGRPVPVLFGDMTISGLNTLWSGEISSESRDL